MFEQKKPRIKEAIIEFLRNQVGYKTEKEIFVYLFEIGRHPMLFLVLDQECLHPIDL